jgi:GDPmannose 4,6-dehydratase
MNKKVVIISGVTGQDGSFMIDYLLKNTDFLIYGGVRRLSSKNHHNIEHIKDPRFKLIDFDLTDNNCISKVIRTLQPDYFINFAAQSFVGSSWDFPKQTFETNATAVIDILEAIRQECPLCRFYNAGTSEEFGDVIAVPQTEDHPLRPCSPYGASKAAARHMVKVYRESYNLYAIQGWLFNHEGTRRGEEFVTRKITKAVARIAHAIYDNIPFHPLKLGNLNVKRDWSDAEDFMDGVWRMLNQELYTDVFHTQSDGKILVRPKEYILSSNETHTIKEFVDLAFKEITLTTFWSGEGLNEKLFCTDFSAPLVEIDAEFFRPNEVSQLFGNSSRARNELGWSTKTNFSMLVRKMVHNDIKNFKS